MLGFQKRRLPAYGLAVAVFLLSGIIRLAHADEQGTQTKPDEAPAQEAAQTKPDEAPAKGATAGGAAAKRPAFDPAVVSAGMAAFQRSCTTCHDAARSLERTKDLAGWRATVKRMAAKRGAEVASSDIEPISVYLASRSAPAAGTAADKEKPGAPGAPADKETAAAPAPSGETSSLSTFATLSPQWRGGHNQVQNPGFGPLAWVGASWQGKFVSGRATLCITCHGVQEPGLISRIEPAEAAVRLDLSSFLEPHCHGMKGGLDAGRFIVPFGAFSALSDPSLYRTVSPPLIFNMGQRLFNRELGFPVLPMPYADEGIDLNLDIPLGDCGTGPITATLDSYLVNGLIGGSNGLDFLQSRDFWDNNNRVASGGRLTVGDPYIRAGASIMGGRFDDPNARVAASGLYYTIYGCDVRAQYKRLFRCQFEYARRDSDRIGTLPTGPGLFEESVYGYYVEAEARPGEKCRVSLLARYDFQSRRSRLAEGTLPTGNFDVERVTLGVNIELWQQSLLMINFERWLLPLPANPNVDVFGVRYTITF
jgi:hypothetical protein